MTTIRHAGRRRRRQTQPPLPTATPTFPGSRIAKRWSVPKASARGINDAASGSTISLHRLSPENRHQPCDPTSPMGPWRPATIRWLPCLCAPVAGSHAIPAGHAIVDVGLIGLAPGRPGPLARVRRPFDGRHPTHKIRDPHDPSTPPVRPGHCDANRPGSAAGIRPGHSSSGKSPSRRAAAADGPISDPVSELVSISVT